MPYHPFELRRIGAQRGPRAIMATVVFASACARATIPPLPLSFPTDTVQSRLVAEGVIQRHIRSPKGPWAIEVLDVDLSRGYCAVAVKGASGAAGRKKTSALLTELAATREVLGGVNADFFSLAGFQGMPTGALISSSKVIVGPGAQPVFAVDAGGAITLGPIRATPSIRIDDMVLAFPNWNRPPGENITVYDTNWGAKLDTATGVIEVVLDGSPMRVSRIDTALAGAEIPARGFVLVAGRNTQASQRTLLRSLKFGDRVDVNLSLAPFHPKEAVGGRPMLARDSVIVPEVETEGQASFRARNPRTAVGLSNNGRRLILAVIDGRQKPYSDGTTLRETAEIMLALGARDAMNLDGGGSSALVYRDSTKALRVANKPSDPTGERAVGDALAIVKGCRSP
jgi:hypothetical protein